MGIVSALDVAVADGTAVFGGKVLVVAGFCVEVGTVTGVGVAGRLLGVRSAKSGLDKLKHEVKVIAAHMQ